MKAFQQRLSVVLKEKALKAKREGGWLAALFVAQVLHALSFATHHTACIAMVSRPALRMCRVPGTPR